MRVTKYFLRTVVGDPVPPTELVSIAVGILVRRATPAPCPRSQNEEAFLRATGPHRVCVGCSSQRTLHSSGASQTAEQPFIPFPAQC